MIFSENSFQGISYVKLPHLHFLIKSLSFSETSFKGISFVKLNPWLVLRVLYPSVSRLSPYPSLRGPAQIYTTRATARCSLATAFDTFARRSRHFETLKIFYCSGGLVNDGTKSKVSSSLCMSRYIKNCLHMYLNINIYIYIHIYILKCVWKSFLWV